MNETSRRLLDEARKYRDILSNHEILSSYWDDLSLVLKGSVARGNADRHSDIDFVFFTDDRTLKELLDNYRRAGLTDRTDGIFLPLPDWIGHYHFEPYGALEKYFTRNNFPQIWEYTNTIAMHDPGGKFGKVIGDNSSRIFKAPLPFLKDKYLELQLTLDWLRHPLKRSDKIAVLLHGSRIVQIVCQLCYLLDEKPYPHDKWISHYLDSTAFGREHKEEILSYAERIVSPEPIEHDLELEEYRQFEKAENLTGKLGSAIAEKYGEQKWIGEWYLFV